MCKALVFVANCAMKNTTLSHVTLCKIILLPLRQSVKPGDEVTLLLTLLFFQLLICNLTPTSNKLICTGI
jgi:hypothetical protein